MELRAQGLVHVFVFWSCKMEGGKGPERQLRFRPDQQAPIYPRQPTWLVTQKNLIAIASNYTCNWKWWVHFDKKIVRA